MPSYQSANLIAPPASLFPTFALVRAILPLSKLVAPLVRNSDLMGSSKDKEKSKPLAKGTARKSKPVAESKPKKPRSSSSSSSGIAKKKKPPADEPAKKKKKRERMDTEVASDDDAEAEVVDDGEDEAQDMVEVVSDDEDVVADKKKRASKPDTRTEAEKLRDERLKSARRNSKSRRRGYRTIAKRAGYSTDVKRAGHDGSFDVAIPVTTVSEAIRACKWAPSQEEKPAFEGLTEFEERTQLSLESLPKSAARVFHAQGEQFLRRLSTGVVQSATDQLKTRATSSMVASVTRPLKRALKYSFVAPKGVVRYSQKDAKGIRLGYADGEQSKLDEDKVLQKMQVSLKKQLAEKAKLEKDPALNNKEGTPEAKEAQKAYKKCTDRIFELREQAKKEMLA